MSRPRHIRHEFVEGIPKLREEGVLYVSIPYATAVHNCFCGCGAKVVTPISPVGWQLGFDGETVSLTPSVGNWSYACRSHYVISHDKAVWAGDMADEDIADGRRRDQAARQAYFSRNAGAVENTSSSPTEARRRKRGFWSWLTRRR